MKCKQKKKLIITGYNNWNNEITFIYNYIKVFSMNKKDSLLKTIQYILTYIKYYYLFKTKKNQQTIT